ncbi:hypothetical protein EV363DRAFT_1399253 [Boletus edulis]|nr:hypothetical protein EV363DRAFT_1399253 [Boletus edulis]
MKRAKANNLASMLPKDRQWQKDESQTSRQSMLEPHLQPPISALEHPAFKNMINIAARATNGVRLPGRR